MMRILQVVHGWFPAHAGGTERYVARLAEELRSTGHELAIATGSSVDRESPGFEKGEWRGFPLYHLHRTGLYLESWMYFFSPDVAEMFQEVLRDFQPDVVHIHHWKRLSSNLVELSRAAGARTVVTLHDLASTCPRVFRVRDGRFCHLENNAENCASCVSSTWFQTSEELGRAVEVYRQEMLGELAAADVLITPSDALKKTCVRFSGLDPQRIEVVPHGDIRDVPCPRPALPDQRKKNEPRRRLVLGTWGVMTPMKGMHHLLGALRRLAQDRRPRLRVWGEFDAAEPEYESYCRAAAEDLEVEFLGGFSADTLETGPLDLAVFPAICLESYSFTVDEAWARGIPVLVPDQGGPSDRLNGAGFRYSHGSPRDLESVLRRLVREPALVQEAARKIAGPVSMYSHAERLLELYSGRQTTTPREHRDDSTRSTRRTAFLARLLREREKTVYQERGQFEGRRDETNSLRRELTLRDDLLKERDRVLNEFAASTENLEEERRRLETDNSALRHRLSEVEKSRERELGDRDLVIRQRDVVLEEFRCSVLEYQRRLAGAEQELESLRTRIAESTASLVEKEKLLTRVRTELADERRLSVLHHQDQKSLSTRIQELESQVREFADQCRLLEDSRNTVTETLQHQTEFAQREMEQLRRHLAEKVTRIREESLRTIQLEEEVKSIQETATDLREQVRCHLVVADARAVQVAEMQRQYAAIEQLRATDKSISDRLETIRSNLESALVLESKKSTSLEQELESCTRDLHDASISVQHANDALHDLERSLNSACERLRPIAEEASGSSLDPDDLEGIVDWAVGNHSRLHQLLSERDQVLAALVQSLGDMEQAVSPLDRLSLDYQKRSVWLSRQLNNLRRRVRPLVHGSRLKILVVVHDFLPRHAAGTEIYTFNLCRELSARHDIHLMFCEARHELPRYTVSKGTYQGLDYTEVVHNYKWENFEETYKDPRMETIFEGVLDGFQPDIVHIQHLHYFSIDFVGLARRRDIPVVYTLHEYILLCARGGQLRRADGELCEQPIPAKCAECITHEKLGRDYGQGSAPGILDHLAGILPIELRPAFERFAGPRVPARLDERWRQAFTRAVDVRLETIKASIRDVNLFISPSAFLRQKFIDSGFIAAEKIIHSDNGFDTTPFEKVKRQPSTTLRFGFVGTIAEYKGVHVLVEAFNDICDANVELQIWGDVETFQEYKNFLVPKIRNPAIRIMGRFDNSRIAEVLSGLDVLIVPSLWFENSPLTIHEAWMAGLPVIASNRGGMAELVQDGINGLLFEMGSAVDLRAKIRRIIEDESLYNRLRRSPGQVKSIQDNAVEIEGYYYSLVTGGGKISNSEKAVGHSHLREIRT